MHQYNSNVVSVIERHEEPVSAASATWVTLSSLVLTDIATVSASALMAVAARFSLSGGLNTSCYIIAVPALLLFTAVFSSVGLYSGIAESPIAEFKDILRATTISYLMIISITFFTKSAFYYSRSTIVLAWLLTTLLLPAARTTMRTWCSRRSWWGINTVILGAGSMGQEMLQLLEKRPNIGLRPVAVLDHLLEKKPTFGHPSGSVFWGDISLASRFARGYSPCFAIIALPNLENEQLSAFIQQYAGDFYRVLLIPEISGIASMEVKAKDFCGVFGLEVTQLHSKLIPQAVKRCFDLLLAAGMSAIFLPVFAAICLYASVSSPDPILYGQRRIGRNNTEFTAWKFRTMVMDADSVLEQHLKDNPLLRQEWNVDHKLKKDPRITPLGRILRKFSLDELPQLWNVLCGQMSLVGPRPIVRAEAGRYGQRFALYQKVQPGITGLWQISGRNNTTYEERTRLDEYYVTHWSILLDLYILLRTFRTVLSAEGAY